MKSVLAVHDKVSELLSTFSSKLQEQENKRSELESEIKQLKKQLGLDSTQGKMRKNQFLLTLA